MKDRRMCIFNSGCFRRGALGSKIPDMMFSMVVVLRNFLQKTLVSLYKNVIFRWSSHRIKKDCSI